MGWGIYAQRAFPTSPRISQIIGEPALNPFAEPLIARNRDVKTTTPRHLAPAIFRGGFTDHPHFRANSGEFGWETRRNGAIQYDHRGKLRGYKLPGNRRGGGVATFGPIRNFAENYPLCFDNVVDRGPAERFGALK